ncbi:uncharacterized protein N7500_005433 [Penicillium coprophilum]|uniref:uncharacterized protein n=1 Tax=Penicillium coprophilum TaxID=36646 RepID=UPI0023974119|nr:uncharacterized protein N7500_005433 [Penicillium coprophilum]KAJ5163603.1 hypothetical protein N7500_005433 [Penicillium coprophilum]
MASFHKMLKWPLPSHNQNSHYTTVHSANETERSDEMELLSEKPISRSHLRSRRHIWIYNSILLLSFMLAVSSLLVAFTSHYTIVRRNLIEVNLPYGNPIPPVPLEMRKFGPAEIFTERSSARSDAAWEALAGPTLNDQGFIYVPNWEDLKLPPGGVVHGEMMYGISMFHQLHCLVSGPGDRFIFSLSGNSALSDSLKGAIRHVFWQLMDGKLDPVAFEALDGDTTDPNFIPRGHGLWHIEHCFNYVRHALQCYGDTTMEVPTDFNGQLIFIGWNTTHQCRNFDTIWDYTVKHSTLDGMP